MFRNGFPKPGLVTLGVQSRETAYSLSGNQWGVGCEPLTRRSGTGTRCEQKEATVADDSRFFYNPSYVGLLSV